MMKRFLQFIPLGLLIITCIGSAVPVFAQPQEEVCEFGSFEAPLPGFLDEDGTTKTICQAIAKEAPLVSFIATIAKVFMGLIIGTGLMLVVVAGYVYMTAGGSAEQVGKAKKMIVAALLGIILALASFMILNTISPQFASEVKEPSFSPAPAR